MDVSHNKITSLGCFYYFLELDIIIFFVAVATIKSNFSLTRSIF
jgi:hypothetical protein